MQKQGPEEAGPTRDRPDWHSDQATTDSVGRSSVSVPFSPDHIIPTGGCGPLGKVSRPVYAPSGRENACSGGRRGPSSPGWESQRSRPLRDDSREEIASRNHAEAGASHAELSVMPMTPCENGRGPNARGGPCSQSYQTMEANDTTPAEGERDDGTEYDRRTFLKAAAVAAAAAPSAAGVTAAAVEEQRERLLSHAQAGDAGRWEYDTYESTAHIHSQLVQADLGGSVCELDGHILTAAVRDGRIPVDLSAVGPDGEEVGVRTELTADQAERLAVDLLEQAHAAREVSE